jgi:2Fe-2S ferredoxin
MPKIIFVEPDGKSHTVEAIAGRSLMQAATDNLILGIVAECGGNCSCGTCHAYIESPWHSCLPPATAHENSMLEGLLEFQSESRLSCQIEVTDDLDGMVVRLPLTQT